MPDRPSKPLSRTRPVALVTGGAKRLGQAIALRLAEDGWQLAIGHRASATEAQALARQITDAGGVATTVALDLDTLGDDAALDAWWNDLETQLGAVGLLVNNAARFEFDLANTATPASLSRHLTTNLMAPIRLTQALHRACGRAAEQDHGVMPMAAVINLLDQKLVNPNPDFFSYTVSKAALEHATRLMAQALAPALRVLGVSPGISLPSADQTQAEFERAHQETPLGQSSTAQEVAEAVAWLAQARAVTGTTVLVDGGQHLSPSARDVMFTTR